MWLLNWSTVACPKGVQPGENIRNRKRDAVVLDVAASFLPSAHHEQFLLCDVPLPKYSALQPAKYGLKLLLTESK